MHALMIGIIFLGGYACAASGPEASGSSSGSSAPRTVENGSSFELRQGESVNACGATIRFVEVQGDSRCPTGVNCIWAGEATVVVAITSGGNEESVNLVTPSSDRNTAAVGSCTVELLDLAPVPTQEGPPAQTAYRASFRLR